MCVALNDNFGTVIKYLKPTGGLAIYIQFVKPINLVQFVDLTLKYD